MIEFSKPHAGWLHITITDNVTKTISKTVSASYLTDVPGDLLASAITSIKYGTPFCVEIDAEAEGTYILLNTPYIGDLAFIQGKDSFDVRYMDTITLAEEIVKFTEENIEEIYNWNMFTEDEEDEKKEYKTMIDSRLKELKELIKEEKERY